MDAETMELQHAIDRALKRGDDAYVRAGRSLGLSPSAFDILYALVTEGEGCTQTQLCEMSYSNKQTVNSSVHKLEREGIVRLEPGIGRSTLVYLTEAGRRTALAKIEPVLRAEEKSIEALSPAEREEVRAAIERYTDALVANLDAIAESTAVPGGAERKGRA